MPSALPWILLGIAALLVVLEALRHRTTRSELTRLEAELEAALAELEAVQRKLRAVTEERRKRSEELVRLRRKLERRGREGETTRPEPGGTARAELESLRAELRRRDARLDELETELAGTRRALERALAERLRPPEEPGGEAAPAERIAELERRAEAAERELEEAREQVERLRRRIRNQEVLYTSVRSELEVKKDRLRAQQEEIERLRALRVVLGAVEQEPSGAEPGSGPGGQAVPPAGARTVGAAEAEARAATEDQDPAPDAPRA